MIDEPEVSGRPLDDGGMTARPPGLVGAGRSHDRVVRGMLPGAMNGTGTRSRDHVARGRAGRAADSRDEIKPFAMSEDFRAFRREHLHHPIFRISPGFVHVLELAYRRKTVVGELNPSDAIDEEVSLTVLAHGVSGIDCAADAKINRLAPRPPDVVCMNDEDGDAVATHRRDVDVVTPGVLDEIQRPH